MAAKVITDGVTGFVVDDLDEAYRLPSAIVLGADSRRIRRRRA